MSLVEQRKDGTSAGGAKAAGNLFACVLGFAAVGTTAAYASPIVETRTSANYDTILTRSLGMREDRAPALGPLVFDLKRVSGLTWDEMADVLGVSRRTVHFWANGGAINARNEQRLRRTAHAIEAIARPNARDTRELLMQPLGGGLLIDLLRAERFDDVRIGATLAAQARGANGHSSDLNDDPPVLAALGTLEDRPIESGKFMRVGRRANKKT